MWFLDYCSSICFPKPAEDFWAPSAAPEDLESGCLPLLSPISQFSTEDCLIYISTFKWLSNLTQMSSHLFKVFFRHLDLPRSPSTAFSSTRSGSLSLFPGSQVLSRWPSLDLARGFNSFLLPSAFHREGAQFIPQPEPESQVLAKPALSPVGS